MKKVLLTFTVALCVLLGLGMVSAQAETYTGSCGENVTYTLDTTTCVLTISGEGAMSNYYSASDSPPWSAYSRYVKAVVIEEGITRVGYAAFSNCSVLTEVSIPDTVTEIHPAFNGCSSLVEIKLPFIGSKRGGSGKFNDVFGYIFGYTSTYTSGYTLQSYDTDSYYYYQIPSTLQEVTITDETIIPYGAFYQISQLINVNISDTVTTINDYAFFNCAGIEKITIPESVKSIGSNAFRYCNKLTLAIYKGNKNDITIGTNNSELTSVIAYTNGICGDKINWIFIPETGMFRVSGLGDMTDYSAENDVPWNKLVNEIENVTIEGSVTSIGSHAFSNCENLKTIIIPKSVIEIDEYAFENCSKLKHVYYVGSEVEWEEIFISRNGNYDLTGYATIHYDYKAEGETIIPDTEGRTPTIGKTTFTFTPEGAVKGDIIAVVVVKDGISTSYAKTYSGEGDVTFVIENGFNSIKVLVWDSYESMEPLMEEYATIE